VSAWTHFIWLVLAIPGTWVLWRLSRGDWLKRAGMLIFGASLVACYTGSWLYHSVPQRLAELFATIDHIGIYLLIAGTTTPIGLVVLRGWWRIGLVGGIWALALTGILLRLLADLSLSVMTGYYLVMGWIGCAMYFELARVLSHASIRPIWVGGLFYSAGAVLNGLHWPTLIPNVFGSHELFHLFVMAGSLVHYKFILRTILPYRQPVPAQQAVTEAPVQGQIAALAEGVAS
jgi:hemolysin III